MELSILLTKQIMGLFFMGMIGFIIVKTGKLKEEDSRIISWVVAYICSPCVVIDAFQIDFTQEKLAGLALAVAAAVFSHIILIGGTKLLVKPLNLNGIEHASIAYPNCGNLIVPLVTAVLGPEWVFYTAAYMMVQTVMIWTHGQIILSGDAEIDYKKIFLNPNVIAIGVGLILFATGIRLPVPLDACISGFGSTIGPLSMLVVGMLIGNLDLKLVFARKRPYLICVMRLIVFPLITTLVYGLSGIVKVHPDAEYILLVSLLASSAPVAVMVTQLSQIHGKDSRYASIINVMSVLFCIVTMPVMVYIFESLI
ncbi:AEC family transporter [Sporofaciens sp. SGI.106]|uniref:AEC family transporter n=1 Tax=Sporofaciens sp. SGI.106 TaxID=3420568 RepID=UPI002AA065F9|nr:AEC family transporter [Lachnoclostridium sp.]